MELIKTTVKVGNSAGVLLPKKYLNSQVKIILEPLNIEKDVIEILMDEKILDKIMGIYIVGSYAREEQTIESDIDILVITSDLNKKIIKEKYEIICISKGNLEKQLSENVLPILPMIKEAKIIMNSELIKNYMNSPLNKKNLKWHIDTTLSAMRVVKEDINLNKELEENNVSDASIYSLILRLRTLYIIECIKKNKKYNKKDFLMLIKNISGSLNSYEGYTKLKAGKKSQKKLSIKEAEKLMNYINKKIDLLRK